MKKEAIITLPNPHLRQKSSRINEITADVSLLIKNMTDASIDWENSRPHEISAALAAVQINVLQRVIIIRSSFEEKENTTFTALINPEIIKYEGEITYDYEGCLSVANIYGKVPRHSKVRVRALDSTGNQVRFKASGFLARVIQHEIDHMNGTMFIDHIKEQADAFYTLDGQGELRPLNYDSHISGNHTLWP